MQSKHALILALLTGACALLVVLAGLLSLSFLELAEPYLTGREERKKNPAEVGATAPTFTTKLEGSQVQIVELDDQGYVTRLVYVSDLNDAVADFTLFAVPQTTYDGKIYVQSVQDAEGTTLIVYPLIVETGKMSPAILNVVSNHATVSPSQDRVAVINTTQVKNITAYDLASGTVLASWTLDANERLVEATGYSRTYTGNGVRWTNNSCFEHAVWVDNVMEIRTFCIEGAI